MLQVVPTCARGVRVPGISIPEDVPDGALREYLEWLARLHKNAGWPSSRELARQLHTTHTTVTRLFKAYPANKRLAYDLIRYLAENALRPTVRSESDWDHFYEKVEQLLEEAESLQKTVPPRREASEAGNQHFIHIVGPDGGGEVSDFWADRETIGRDSLAYRKLKFVMEAVAESSAQVFLKSQRLINPDQRVGTVIEEVAQYSVHSKTVLALFEDFHQVFVAPNGIHFKTRRIHARPGTRTEVFPDLTALLGRFDKAIVLLSGHVHDDWQDEDVSLQLLGDNPASEAVIAEIFPPEDLSAAVNSLASDLIELDHPSVDDIGLLLCALPMVRKCLTLGT